MKLILVANTAEYSNGLYQLTVAQSSDASFDYVYGYGKDGNYGALTPTEFQGTNINYLVSRTNQKYGSNVKFQQKLNLDTAISAPNGLRITRTDTNESVVLPSLDGENSARFHLANSTNPVIKRTDVGKTITLLIEVV